MSGVYVLNPGEADGHLTFVSTGRTLAHDILMFHPEIQKELDEIASKGWKFLYIETIATSTWELNITKSKFEIKSVPIEVYGAKPRKSGRILELSINDELPKMTAMPEIQVFRVNVCSKSFPRAATLDLSKHEVTYLHDAFWKWEAGSEVDEKKFSNAIEVYEIAAWLIDEKKFKFAEEVTEERYNELLYRFKKMLSAQ